MNSSFVESKIGKSRNMAATSRLILKTKEIIKASASTYNRTILCSSNRHRLLSRNFASSSKGDSNESDSSDSKTVGNEQKTDSADASKIKKSVWFEPIPECFRGDHLPNPVRNTEREYFQQAADPNRKDFFEGKYYSKKRGITKEVYDLLHFDINIDDDGEILVRLRKYEFVKHKKDQRYSEEQIKTLGHELGAGHFIISRGGAVKFVGRDQWYVKGSNNSSSIPTVFVSNLFIEAIDASNMKLTYVGFDHLERLSHLRYLRFKDCPYLDDWCLSRLQRQSETLEYLDISSCPGITDHGLSALHCLQNLKVLRLSNLQNVKQIGLLALLLEEKIPGLMIVGVKDEEFKPPSWEQRGESRLVRALLGYLQEEDAESIGKVEELQSNNDLDYNFISNSTIRRVE